MQCLQGAYLSKDDHQSIGILLTTQGLISLYGEDHCILAFFLRIDNKGVDLHQQNEKFVMGRGLLRIIVTLAFGLLCNKDSILMDMTIAYWW